MVPFAEHTTTGRTDLSCWKPRTVQAMVKREARRPNWGLVCSRCENPSSGTLGICVFSQVELVVKNWQFDPWVGKIPWRKAGQPTPVFLSGESHGQRSLVGYSPFGRKEWDRKKWLSTPTPGMINVKKRHFGIFLVLSGLESTCQRRKHRCDPWSRMVPYATGQLNPWGTATKASAPQSLCPAAKKPPQWEAHDHSQTAAPTQHSWGKPECSKGGPKQPRKFF